MAVAEAEAQAVSANGKDKQHWVLFEIDAERSKGLREMARVAGGKAKDFYATLFLPALDKALSDFEENRDLVAARAKAQAAATAAEKAAEIARKAQEELAAVEGAGSRKR